MGIEKERTRKKAVKARQKAGDKKEEINLHVSCSERAEDWKERQRPRWATHTRYIKWRGSLSVSRIYTRISLYKLSTGHSRSTCSCKRDFLTEDIFASSARLNTDHIRRSL